MTYLNTFAVWISNPGVALIWSGFTFLVGAFIGHWFSRSWDRTKEFNSIADPLRMQLRKELGNSSADRSGVDMVALELLGDLMNRRQRQRFSVAIADYKEARKKYRNQDPAYGSVSYGRIDHIDEAINKLLLFVRHK